MAGITDADAAERQIDDAAVQALAADAAVVIAYNASFDRQMFGCRWPVFADKNWTCSGHQILWRAESHAGMKLGNLLIDHRFFYNGHQAIDDTHALLRLLDSPLRTSGCGSSPEIENVRVEPNISR